MKIKLQKKLISKVENRIVFAIEEYKKIKCRQIPAVDNQAILRAIREELSLWATKPRLIYEVVRFFDKTLLPWALTRHGIFVTPKTGEMRLLTKRTPSVGKILPTEPSRKEM